MSATLRAVAAVALALLLTIVWAVPALAADAKVVVDRAGGTFTSLVLDAGGSPVISYFGETDAVNDLKLARCTKPNCRGPKTITTADATGTVGQYSSVVLDSVGFPVVSYYDASNGDLKVLHCGNADCTSGNAITSPDTGGNVGLFTSIALDAGGFPVVSYHDVNAGDLKVLHCGDATCGANNTISNPDTGGINSVGLWTSLALDSAGFPVVSYHDDSANDLRVLHCGDANCTSGNTISTADATGSVGEYTSLLLDGSGFPAVSYYDSTNSDLKVLRCGNAACTSGNTISAPDGATGSVGQYTSLALDASGFPVVSYFDNPSADLRVLHCGDASCSSGNTISVPDERGNVGQYSSLALDGNGFPVVSYTGGNQDLKLLSCDDAACS